MAEKCSSPGCPSGLMVTSGQVQQLISTNEALLKTNESLKEMVISVVELLKDPTRHVTYAEPSISEADDSQHRKAFPTFPSENPPDRSSSPPSRLMGQGLPADTISQGSARERGNCASLVEEIYPMTLEELEAEDAMYRQKYKGESFHHKVGWR